MMLLIDILLRPVASAISPREIIGRSTGIRLTLGSPVRIRVKRADLQKRQLDFEVLLPDAATRRAAAASEGRGKGPKVRTSSRRKGK